MKILFVAPWLPSRIRPRSYGFLRHLAQRHEVWLLSAGDGHESAADLAHLDLAGIDVIQRRAVHSGMRAARALLSQTPLQVALLNDPRLRDALQSRIREFQPDVVHFNVIRSGGLLDVVPKSIPRIFDLDDIRSDYYSQLAGQSRNPFWRAIGRVESRRLKTFEHRVAADVDVTLVSSPADIARVAPNAQLVRSPHDAHPRTADRPQPQGRSILFVGRLGYRANREALDAFLAGPWRGIHDQLPDVELVVVGEDPRGRYKSDDRAGIRVTGFVPDVTPFYESATLAIVPVTMATGVQMKLVQALAQGVPVVTTAVSARQAGLPDDAARQVSSTDQWESAVVELIGSPEEAAKLGARGQAWALENYSSATIARALDVAYAMAIDSRAENHTLKDAP